MAKVDSRRVRVLKEGDQGTGPVVYWMSRDQRVADNWAFLFAQELALEQKTPLAVLFCLVPGFLGATIRHYGFMLKGLREVETRLGELAIPFFLVSGEPHTVSTPSSRISTPSSLSGSGNRGSRLGQIFPSTRLTGGTSSPAGSPRASRNLPPTPSGPRFTGPCRIFSPSFPPCGRIRFPGRDPCLRRTGLVSRD
jgi:hypothetical protein